MNYDYYDQFINKETKGRYDVTPLFENPKAFAHLVDDLAQPFEDIAFDKVAGLESLGFVLGAALAIKCGVGFVCVRKAGRLPGAKDTLIETPSFIDYTNQAKKLEINEASIKKHENVLIIDEWIETGAQMGAAADLIERLGGKVIGISVLCAHKNQQTMGLFDTFNLKAIRVLEER